LQEAYQLYFGVFLGIKGEKAKNWNHPDTRLVTTRRGEELFLDKKKAGLAAGIPS
jgi:hypothetical protein